MPKTETKPKAAPAKATKQALSRTTILKDQELQLLMPDEFEAITKANYYHPESRIVLQLFLQANYFWHITRFMQGKKTSIKELDWVRLEINTSTLISKTLETLLTGVQVTPWEEATKKKPH